MPYVDPAQTSLPYQQGSDTSYDAAVQAKQFARTQREQYAAWVRARGEFGATDAEAEQGIPMRRSSVCARRNELEKARVIQKTDRRRGGCAVYVAS